MYGIYISLMFMTGKCFADYKESINDSNVTFGENLVIKSIRTNNLEILKNFGWIMQGKRNGKIKYLRGQNSVSRLQTKRVDGKLVYSTGKQTVGDIIWQGTLSTTKRGLKLTYDFQVNKDMPSSWLLISAKVPNGKYCAVEKITDGYQIRYKTPAGMLGFQYDRSEVSPDLHRPRLKTGPRFMFVTTDKNKSRIKYNFAKGDRMSATFQITLPKQSVPDKNAALRKQVKIGFAETKQPNWLYTPGQPMRVTIPIKIDKTFAASPLHTQLILGDFWGNEHQVDSRDLNTKKLSKDGFVYQANAPKAFGPYRLTLKLTNAQGQHIQKDVAVFGVRNPQWLERRLPIDDSYMGATIHGKANIALARKLGFRWKRGEFEVMWTANSPLPHVYTFKRELIDEVHAQGMEEYGQLAYCAWWGVEATQAEIDKVRARPHVHHILSSRPPIWKNYREYVRKAATFFKNDIRYWELWNEPNVPIFWRGSPKQYLHMLKITHKELKDIIPNAKIMAPGGAGIAGLDGWGNKLIKLGALKYIDIWSIHQYIHDDYLDVDSFRNQLRKLRKILDENGGKHLEIWNSESGTRAISWFRDADFAKWPPREDRLAYDPRNVYSLIKLYAVQKAEGVRKNFHYFFKAYPRYAALTTCEFTGALRYSLYPIAAWGGIIDGSKYADCWEKDKLGYVYFFQNGNNAVAMLWADLPKGDYVTLPLDFKPGIQAFDVLGNAVDANKGIALSVAPCYLKWNNHTVKQLQRQIYWDRLPKLSNPVLQKQRISIPDLQIPHIADFSLAKEMGDYLKPLDISKFCNMGFVDPVVSDGKGGWSDEGPYNDFRGITVGKRKIFGVPFILIDPAQNNDKSIISFKADTFPQGVERVKIPYGKKMRAMFIMHASANYTSMTKGPALSIILHYADGRQKTMPLSIPEQMNDAWTYPNPELEEQYYTKTYPMKVSAKNRGMRKKEKDWVKKTGNDYIYRFVRVTCFENPIPEEVVKYIELVSNNPHGVPMVLGISAH